MIFNKNFLIDKHKKIEFKKNGNNYIGKQMYYHENGQLKEESCYTYIQKNGLLDSVLCGTQVFYDETGKEIKRINHKTKCEYGCDEAPRRTLEELVAEIKTEKEKSRQAAKIIPWKKLPIIGKIVSIDKTTHVIDVEYREGYTLDKGDEIYYVFDSDTVSNIQIIFECIENRGTIGKYILKEDHGSKFSFLNKGLQVRYYRKNVIKNDAFLKHNKQYKSGDVEVVGNIEFVYIPAGEIFSTDSETRVQIKAFWLSKYEMTWGEYLKCCYEVNKYSPENQQDTPLNSTYPVNLDKYFNEAKGYCEWFGYKYNVSARLPLSLMNGNMQHVPEQQQIITGATTI